MGKSYSADLRDRVVALVEGGCSRRAASRHFGVSESFAIKLMQRVIKLGSSSPAKQGRPPGNGKLAACEAFLISVVEERPDITMPELSARLLAERSVEAQPASLSRFLCQRGFTYKKNPMASEAGRADIRAERRFWIDRRQPRMRLEPHRLVFVDETSVTTKACPREGV